MTMQDLRRRKADRLLVLHELRPERDKAIRRLRGLLLELNGAAESPEAVRVRSDGSVVVSHRGQDCPVNLDNVSQALREVARLNDLIAYHESFLRSAGVDPAK